MPKNADGMSEIKMLHLSDFHLDSSNPKDTEIILNALWKDLNNFEEIDFILFSGDLVKAGDKKGDFEKAFQVFIKPLLTKTNLTMDDFFLVPGNHDIQMSRIKKVIELGLKEMLKDRDSLNAFLDEEMKNGFENIERLNHFNEFKTRFNAGHTVTSNKLFSTHIIKKKNIEIGLACLNSTWRATGRGSNDKGKLLIGERQIDDALKDIKKCDIKIALYHHALDWLMEYDLGDAKKVLSREFDFLFCGHLHDPNLELVQSFQNEAVLIQGGSLNNGRSYYNGYSVLGFNVQDGEGTICLRSYFDDRRAFDKAVNKCEDGKMPISLEREKFDKKQEITHRAPKKGTEKKDGKQSTKKNNKIKGQAKQTKTKEEEASSINFPTEEYIKCQGRPVRELVTSRGIYLQTEANEWIFWTANANISNSLFNIKPVTEAFIDKEEQLVVGLFESNVAHLKEGKWEYIQWNPAVLSLVQTKIGIVVGDSAGTLGLLEAQRKTTPSPTVQEPVTDILNINEEKLLILGTKGGLWSTEWPFDRSAQMKPINITNFERIFGLIESKTASDVILLGSARIASLDCESGKIKNVSSPFEDSIRSVYANQGKTGGYSALTDEGGLYLLSDDLKMTNKVKISIDEGRVAGVRPLPKGGFLAWTTEGNLYRVKESSAFKQIASNNVVMAFPDRDDLGIYIVRWYGVEGVYIQFKHIRGSMI